MSTLRINGPALAKAVLQFETSPEASRWRQKMHRATKANRPSYLRAGGEFAQIPSIRITCVEELVVRHRDLRRMARRLAKAYAELENDNLALAHQVKELTSREKPETVRPAKAPLDERFDQQMFLYLEAGTSPPEIREAPPEGIAPAETTNFFHELRSLLNKYSSEARSDTPDFVLAEFLLKTLDAFNGATRTRDNWFTSKAPTAVITPCVSPGDPLPWIDLPPLSPEIIEPSSVDFPETEPEQYAEDRDFHPF
jgi:hypothetical protein